METLKQRFGLLVSANRKRKGLTQQSLADRSGLGLEMVNRIERGRVGPRFATIEKLAKALDLDPAELFTPNLPRSAIQTPELTQLTSRLAGLAPADVLWVDRLVDAALKPRASDPRRAENRLGASMADKSGRPGRG